MGTDQHRIAPDAVDTVAVPLAADLRGRLVRRYKRFFADVELASGEVVTVHCPNPGSMKGCAIPGSAVRCSTSDNPKRKLRHTLEMIRVGRAWVGLHTLVANRLVAKVLAREVIPELAGYDVIQSEAKTGGKSRLDFRLSQPRAGTSGPPIWVEVKSVTLAEGNRAYFPDSVTERGKRHLEVLTDLHHSGDRAALLFLVQRADCHSVSPADDIDPAYGIALREAAKAGVEIYALGARVTARSVAVERRLPVVL